MKPVATCLARRTTMHGARDKWLALDDAALLAECGVDAYRAGGPGGQHRNKVSSAVRLRHHPSGLLVIAEESRSQHENKARALRRLRLAIALNCRQPIDDGWQPPEALAACQTPAGRVEIAIRNPAYPVVVAVVLDVIAASQGRLREAGALLGLTTGQLSRFITRDGKLLAAVNHLRHQAGLRPLTADR